MGINIKIINKNQEDHPDWDCRRHSGDADFYRMISYDRLRTEEIFDEAGNFLGIRPSDFSIWRGTVKEINFPNPERIERLIKILEDNEDFCLDIG